MLLVPIVPLVPMDERNLSALKPNRSENSLSLLNEMQFVNGVPMECQIILLIPMDERNPAVLKPNRSENSLSPVNKMQFTNGVPMDIKSFHWYQLYYWYQWTNGISLYSNRTVVKIV